MMRKIYLFRHCETEKFPAKRCIGLCNIDLSEKGIEDAARLKAYLSDKRVCAVFCSDAVRAEKTARIMADAKIKVTKHHALHEIDMGDWDGMYFDDIKKEFPEEYRRRGADFAGFCPPNGESFADCQKRAQDALHFILESTDGNIAVVAHAGFNRALICGICRIDLNKLFSIPQPFGCVNILTEQNGVIEVLEAGITAVS